LDRRLRYLRAASSSQNNHPELLRIGRLSLVSLRLRNGFDVRAAPRARTVKAALLGPGADSSWHLRHLDVQPAPGPKAGVVTPSSHLVARGLDDGQVGFAEANLAEWLGPETLTFAVYANSLEDFKL
jgi:hypothetical protein